MLSLIFGCCGAARDAPSYDSAISRGPRREPPPLPSFELPDGQSYAQVADELRREARTRLRSQMGTSKDSIFFAELMPASDPPAPEPSPTPAERWCTEYSNKFLSHSTEEVVLRNVHPYGGATSLLATVEQPGASRPVSETVETVAPDPTPAAYNQDVYAEVPAATVTFAGGQHAVPSDATAEESPTGDAQHARAAREKRNKMHQKQIKQKLRRPDTTSRDMADTAVAAATNNGVSQLAFRSNGLCSCGLAADGPHTVLYTPLYSARRSTATAVAPALTRCQEASCTQTSRFVKAAAATARRTTSRRPRLPSRLAENQSTSRCTAAHCTVAML